MEFKNPNQFSAREYLGNISYHANITTRGYIILFTSWLGLVLLIEVSRFFKVFIQAMILCFKNLMDALKNMIEYCCKALERTTSIMQPLLSINIDSKVKILFLVFLLFYLFETQFYHFFETEILSKFIVGGYDMQWYPSTQFWGLHGYDTPINPYQEALNGNSFIANAPNYGHLLYILMYPFARFEFLQAKQYWIFFNIACIIVVFFLLCRIFMQKNLSLLLFACIAILFCRSAFFQAAIWTGNIPLLMCLCIVLAFLYRNNFLILTLSLSILCTKYTFGIPIMIGFFLAGYYRAVICAGLINILAAILFAFKFHIVILDSILLPAKVGLTTVSNGTFNLMGTASQTFGGLGFKNPLFYLILLCLTIWIALILYIKPAKERIIFSSFLIALCVFLHLVYDYSTLLAVFLAGVVIMKHRSLEFYFFVIFIAFFFLLPFNFCYDKHHLKHVLFALGIYLYTMSLLLFPYFKQKDSNHAISS